ncbi:hypothetical protein MTO96_017220 [Rhipicephalus appendiculatus]
MAKNMWNLRAAREYVDVVVRRLRDDALLQDVGTTELRSTGDHCGWKLRDGTIRGLGPHQSRRQALADPGAAQRRRRRHTGAAALRRGRHGCWCATATSRPCTTMPGEQQLSGKVSGKVEIVRLDVVIAHPEGPGGMPEVKVFEAKEFTGLTLAKGNIGILHQKLITEVAAEAVRSCVAQAMTSRVAPLLTTVLKGIAYPEFNNTQP